MSGSAKHSKLQRVQAKMRIEEASSGGREYRSGAMRAKDNSFSISLYERQQQVPRGPDKNDRDSLGMTNLSCCG
jgi:hypothetical protein